MVHMDITCLQLLTHLQVNSIHDGAHGHHIPPVFLSPSGKYRSDGKCHVRRHKNMSIHLFYGEFLSNFSSLPSFLNVFVTHDTFQRFVNSYNRRWKVKDTHQIPPPLNFLKAFYYLNFKKSFTMVNR